MSKSQNKNDSNEEVLFDLSALTDEVVAELELKLKLSFARSFESDYIIPARTLLKDLTKSENIRELKRIGHKIGGHSEFPELIKLGEELEKKMKDIASDKNIDFKYLNELIDKISTVNEKVVIPFLEENKHLLKNDEKS